MKEKLKEKKDEQTKVLHNETESYNITINGLKVRSVLSREIESSEKDQKKKKTILKF